MNRYELIFKDKERRVVEADGFQPTGAMITFLRFSRVANPNGEQTADPILVVNVSEVRSVETLAPGKRTGLALV